MRVHVRRVGGFVGLDEDLGSIATESLSAAAAAHLQQVVASLEGSSDDVLGADIPAYQVEITSEEGERRLVFSDMGDEPLNPALSELLRLIGLVPP